MINRLIKIIEKDRKLSERNSKLILGDKIQDLKDEVVELEKAYMNKNYENLGEEMGDVLWNLLYSLIILQETEDVKLNDIIKFFIKKYYKRKPWILENKKISEEEENKIWKENK